MNGFYINLVSSGIQSCIKDLPFVKGDLLHYGGDSVLSKKLKEIICVYYCDEPHYTFESARRITCKIRYVIRSWNYL